MVCNTHQLWCIITLKPFDDDHNHREDHKNTRNVVLLSFRGMNVRIYVHWFSVDEYDANESKFTCLQEEEVFKRNNYRQG